ncbi:hypothetical protein H257_14113 [Aphanomyces astaci]|uniref:Uncharacterized protein n=1 Tax=Aphanomyces astaci TaxID=112090 RepID=W4FU13_APHAT|nr:hypothetical protein H257_14113 [Aphanomyces astaci]ETV70451.1 hypothetical protein H257_14113 [Aphanomyces astaci]|eukprot:XP_009840163.1 hypothetical protein H257_14113 [Aphanomyces astaci]
MKVQDDPLTTTKRHKQQWNASTKLTHAKKPKSPSSLRKEEPPVESDMPTVTEAARSLVEKAVECAVRQDAVDRTETTDIFNHQQTMHARTTEWAVMQEDLSRQLKQDQLATDQRDNDERYAILDVDLHLERVRLEKSRRKAAIQAFQRHLERQIQQLTAMAEAVNQREVVMDAAFNQYETWVQSHHTRTTT